MEAPTSPDPALEEPDAYAGEYEDDEFAPHRRERLGKWTAVLGILVIAGGGFLAGVYVQKSRPAATTSRVSFAGGGASAGFGRGAGTGAGTRTAGTGAGSKAGAASPTAPTAPTAADAAGPAVIGQVVKISGDTLVVQNLGGKQVTVSLTPDTTVSKTATASDLTPGQTVTVGGTTGADGTVTATTVLGK